MSDTELIIRHLYICINNVFYFYDFSADFGGNLVDFVMNHDHVNVAQDINILKQYAPITEGEDSTPIARLPLIAVAKKYRNTRRAPPKCTAKILPDNCMEKFEF